MAVCSAEAVLLITITPSGTTTNVVRSRTELRCALPSGHDGPHTDQDRKETWETTSASRKTLLRHEDGES
jgi:hypothetical protein